MKIAVWFMMVIFIIIGGCNEDDENEDGGTSAPISPTPTWNSNWKKAKEITVKCAKINCWGTRSEQMGVELFDHTYESLTALFKSYSGAVMCGGSSHYLVLALRDSGYKAERVSVLNSVLGHVYVKVWINEEWLILDPSFCVTYTDAEGKKALGLGTIQNLLKEGRHLDIYAQSISEFPVFCPYLSKSGNFSGLAYEIRGPIAQNVYEIQINLKKYIETNRDKMKKDWRYYMFNER